MKFYIFHGILSICLAFGTNPVVYLPHFNLTICDFFRCLSTMWLDTLQGFSLSCLRLTLISMSMISPSRQLHRHSKICIYNHFNKTENSPKDAHDQIDLLLSSKDRQSQQTDRQTDRRMVKQLSLTVKHAK